MKERSKTVNGYKSPEGGPDISDHDLNILASAYASCRKGEKDKTKCSKIAWGAAHRSKKKTEDAPAISGELTSSSIPASDRPENNLGVVKIGVGSTLSKRKKKEATYQRFFWKLNEEEKTKEGTEEWAYDLYKHRKAIPGKWYVHGGKLQKNYTIQCTKDWEVGEQYGRSEKEMWLLRPNKKSKILDFQHESTSDFRKVLAKLISQLRNEKLRMEYPDIYQSLMWQGDIKLDLSDKSDLKQIKDNIWEAFSPSDMVDSAGAYDNPDWTNWLTDYFDPDFVLTQNDCAIANSSDAEFDRVRVQFKLHEDLNEKGFSVDLIFLFHDGKIYVKHNHDQAVPLIELLSSKLYPELREMCGIIFDYIEERYRMFPLMQQWKYSNKPWQVILHSFLVRYFKKAYPVNKLEIRIDEDGKGKREVTIVGEKED